jgi:hypothetical protein
MADLIILKVPEDISVRARQIAETVAQPVEQLLLNHVPHRRPSVWQAPGMTSTGTR